ncbi:MAG: response regulator [Clostridiales bacterium]|jgi:YesN/AraC family two-component response regulator|nr:response regulator [Clostridiales bacterium]
MYTVALVDDEKWALIDNLHIFPFEKYNFKVVGQFTSSTQALARLPVIEPDLLIADIRMPSISGLDLIHFLKASLPNLSSVLLSGYAEFTCAQEALRQGVFEYCLKPLDTDKAEAVLKRVVDRLNSSDDLPESIEYSSGNKYFSMLLRHVNIHIYDKLVLEELAKEFYLNPTYCGQLFKSATGKTFPQYLRDARLTRACELLSRTKMPVSEIARRVGYALPT